MTKKSKKFFSAEEIKKMVLEEKKMPATTNSTCDDFIVQDRNPIGSHKKEKFRYK